MGLRLLVFSLISIALMVVDHRYDNLQKVRGSLEVAITPIRYVVNWPGEAFNWVDTRLTSYQELLDQNASFSMQLLLLKARLQKMVSLEGENAKLRALLQSSQRSDERVLVARLLSINSDPFQKEFVLNKGRKSNIYSGQPVLDADGVLGQVIRVNPFTSRVLLVSDTRSAVPVQDTRNGLRGIVVGKGSASALSMIHIPATSDIRPGDVLVTSALGKRFPLGYPVGVVQSVVSSSGEEFSDIVVKPSAHLNRGYLVLLVWPVNKQKVVMRKKEVKIHPKGNETDAS